MNLRLENVYSPGKFMLNQSKHHVVMLLLLDTMSGPIIIILLLSCLLSDPKKNNCLMFKMEKYLKRPNMQIEPYRMSLWLYIRLVREKSRKKKDSLQARSLDAEAKQSKSKDSNKRRHKKKDNKSTARKDRKKKRRKGRRIKIFVSNGKKDFVKLRMRVRNTGWNKIELPISQFPPLITANHSFQLCIKCKRCNKKVKIDLFRRRPREKEQHTIPFIHVENRSLLPQYRKKRSYRGIDQRHQNSGISVTSYKRHLPNNACCQSEIYSNFIKDISSSILYPESINITYCGTVNHTSVLDSTDNILRDPLHGSDLQTSGQYKCVASSMKDFSFMYFDSSYSVKHATIENLIPSSCECRYVQ